VAEKRTSRRRKIDYHVGVLPTARVSEETPSASVGE
jgi:hypothetical protein